MLNAAGIVILVLLVPLDVVELLKKLLIELGPYLVLLPNRIANSWRTTAVALLPDSAGWLWLVLVTVCLLCHVLIWLLVEVPKLDCVNPKLDGRYEAEKTTTECKSVSVSLSSNC